MIRLNTPLSKEDIRRLRVGDQVLLSGKIYTARDRAHQFLLDNDLDVIRGSVIYHCGPIIKDQTVVSAGPTTSARMNIYTKDLIEKYDIKAIIGKGGMDNEVLKAMRGRAVYLAAVGGAGVVYAQAMKFSRLYLEEFGMAEAIWEFEVKNFPLIVAMDSWGGNLYNDIYNKSWEIYKTL